MSAEFSILANMDAFLLGMKAESVRSSKKVLDLQRTLKDTAKQLDSDLRSVYDTLMPNIHILDSAYTSKLLIRDILTNPQKYFSKILVEEDGFVYERDIDSTNINKAKIAARSLLTESVRRSITDKINLAVHELHSNLPDGGLDPINTLNSFMEPLLTDVHNTLSNDSISHEQKIASVFRLGSLFRKQINSIFGKHALLKIQLPGIGGGTNRYVFFSKNFSDLSGKINPKVAIALSKALTASLNVGMRFTVSDKVSVGSVVHFAHTTVKSGGVSLLNSPAYAKLMYNTVNFPERNKQSPFSDSFRASNYFKQKTGHLKVALSVDKNIETSTSTLMQLGLTFTTDHAATLNLLMATKESKFGSGSTGSSIKASQQLRTILDRRRVGNIVEQLLKGNPLYGTSSPSLISLIESNIVEVISTGKVKPKRYSTKKTKEVTTTYLDASKKVVMPITSKIKESKSNKPVIGDPNIPGNDNNRFSLVSLQNLLNRHLQDVVSANMGDGNSRNVLNYRTGRFAASAKVERLTQSKEGMITAFYSAMRNPYYTFSEGGAQQYPRTRDPKTLISSSIKEIAATMMVARMRAVSI